jgi:hypothetical protein
MNTNYGGLQLLFSYPPTDVITVSLKTNIGGIASFKNATSNSVSQDITVRISSELDVPSDRIFIIVETILGSNVVDRSDYTCDHSVIEQFDIELFFFNTRISVYINQKWIYSYSLATVVYPVTIQPTLVINGGTVLLTNINNVELCDGRNAVYVDYESNSDNAISSIVQERPIQILAAIDRAAEFTYNATKEEVPGNMIKTYEVTEESARQASSDGLVYAIDVGISIDTWMAEHVGFITKLYRLSELDSGVERAVSALQKRARQSMFPVGMSGRFDPRLEVADIVLVSFVASGTARAVSDRVIVEDITMNIQDGVYQQSINGRRDVDVV